jgi:hypothetical protein
LPGNGILLDLGARAVMIRCTSFWISAVKTATYQGTVGVQTTGIRR